MNRFTRELAINIYHGYCGCSKGCTRLGQEIHHKLPNTKTNRKLYPLFIDSIFNLCWINKHCHVHDKPTISSAEAECYEAWLRQFIAPTGRKEAAECLFKSKKG